FFALPGTHTTGNRFISQAILNGAAAVIFQDDFSSEEKDSIQKAMEQKNAKTVFIRVESSRRAMSPVSSAFYDNPSSKLVIYGVTGTEGKSSTVSFIWQLLTLSGYKAGFISTVQYSLGGPAINNPEHQTTPEAPIVQRELYEMVQNGCTHAVVESSSHGLSDKLNRLGDVLFDCAVFMNVTLEHLEFHGTFEQYRNDKANLFRALDRHNHIKTIQGKEVEVPSFGIVNLEDESFPFFVSATNKKVIGYTTEGKAGKQAGEEEQQVSPLPSIPEDMAYLSARNIASARFGLSFSIHRFQDHDSIKNENRVIHVKAPLPGAFNAYNIMAALLAVNGTTGISLEDLSAKATELVPVKGRMTVIDQGQPFEVIVDYAHTPSSFETIFPPLRKRCTGRMIALFGSGGERDIKKRPLQGQVAARFCDILVLTDEDPRQEDSMSILNMIADGAEKEGKVKDKDMFLISDRMEAIKKAFAIAQKDDIVLLLGKSHENSIIFKDRVMPYDEISQAKKTLEEMGYKENKK
ncbi:MAG: UDP-N-acetylmuramyl-tripeptide synthetase, partial [Treponema sp.]|nr:UDP-N-acetylmuramyl-tripeptide synthetase [Treponema sp.]